MTPKIYPYSIHMHIHYFKLVNMYSSTHKSAVRLYPYNP